MKDDEDGQDSLSHLLLTIRLLRMILMVKSTSIASSNSSKHIVCGIDEHLIFDLQKEDLPYRNLWLRILVLEDRMSWYSFQFLSLLYLGFHIFISISEFTSLC